MHMQHMCNYNDKHFNIFFSTDPKLTYNRRLKDNPNVDLKLKWVLSKSENAFFKFSSKYKPIALSCLFILMKVVFVCLAKASYLEHLPVFIKVKTFFLPLNLFVCISNQLTCEAMERKKKNEFNLYLCTLPVNSE